MSTYRRVDFSIVISFVFGLIAFLVIGTLATVTTNAVPLFAGLTALFAALFVRRATIPVEWVLAGSSLGALLWFGMVLAVAARGA